MPRLLRAIPRTTSRLPVGGRGLIWTAEDDEELEAKPPAPQLEIQTVEKPDGPHLADVIDGVLSKQERQAARETASNRYVPGDTRP
ncbi:MAG: hypothetical protein U5K37_03740 [Natrialbaceae archaeon]|nr:hypothetical protein [Natrialbaceae archaeon]